MRWAKKAAKETLVGGQSDADSADWQWGDPQGAKGTNLGAARVSVPPGGGMPEHEHGESETALVVQDGRITVHGGGQQEKLEAGAVALIGVGERVQLENPSSEEPASLLVFFAPPGFVQTFASWPVEEDAHESAS